MQTTLHIQQRMSQRGISREMVNLALTYGSSEHDKYILGRKETLELLEANQREAKLLKKVLDKGGLVVITDGDAMITTYNCKQRRH